MTENNKNSNPNLELWNQVEQTNPEFTKPFRRTGGFVGTAIDPLYNIYRATEIFGPIGIGWGYEILNEQIIEGAPLKDNGQVVGCDKIHEIKVKLWYKYQGEVGSLVTSGATMMVASNKYGPSTDEEAVKKSLTDALSKALSWLGFSADVHLGKFDDQKYVRGLKAAQNENDPGQNKPQNKPQNQNTNQQPQSSESPQIEGVSFEKITGRDGNPYMVAKGDTYKKRSILDKYGFKRRKGEDGKWVVYRPIRQAA